MADLAILIGSGFSKPIGLPLAKEINEYFLRDNAEKVLKFSSGEFMWDDFANETYKHNGRIGYDHLAFGILLNEFVNLYKSRDGGFVNYEEFYQFVIDNVIDEEIISLIKENSFTSFNKHFPHINENPFYKNYTHAIEHFQPREFRSMINHLIGDLLFVRKPKDTIKEQYAWITDFFILYKSVDIITLNHDLLMEYLLSNIISKSYSDGFTKNQNILKSSQGESLNLFQDVFSNAINLIKLHGSIDTYRYAIANEKGSIVNPTGDYLYFKTRDYDEKQKPLRHNPDNGEVVQRFHWDIDPYFITGTRKKEIISKPGIYKLLYEQFEERIMKCKSLLIIGYSYGDDHVNEVINLAILKSKSLVRIINVNPAKSLSYKIKNALLCEFKLASELINLHNKAINKRIKEAIAIGYYRIIRYLVWIFHRLLNSKKKHC
jgi:hypothetical protein